MIGKRWTVTIEDGPHSRQGAQSRREVALVETTWVARHRLTMFWAVTAVGLLIAFAAITSVPAPMQWALWTLGATLVGLEVGEIWRDHFGTRRVWTVPEEYWAWPMSVLVTLAPVGAEVTRLEKAHADAATSSTGPAPSKAGALKDQLEQARMALGVAELELRANLGEHPGSGAAGPGTALTLRQLVERNDRGHRDHR